MTCETTEGRTKNDGYEQHVREETGGKTNIYIRRLANERQKSDLSRILTMAVNQMKSGADSAANDRGMDQDVHGPGVVSAKEPMGGSTG
jgi:hypothetical protein